MKLGVEHVEPDIPRPKPTGDEADDAAAMVRYYKFLERRDVRIEERLARYPMIYADIMLSLSKESDVVIREHSDFGEIDRLSHPVRLWRLITITHTFKDKENLVETKAAAWDGYYLMRMNEKDDSLFEFKKRTDNALAAITAAEEEPPSHALQAQNFNNRLCSKYGTLILSYKNKLKEKPAALAQAYKLASEHRVLSRTGDAVTVNHLDQATVFVSTVRDNEKASNASGTDSYETNHKSGDKEKKKKKKKKKIAESASVREDDKDSDAERSKEKRSGREDRDRDKKPWHDCYLCGEVKDRAGRRHWPSDCPRLPQFQGLVKDGVINAAFGVEEFDFGSVCL